MAMSRPRAALAALVLALHGAMAVADDLPAPAAPAESAASPFDFGVGVGTAGVGAQLSMQLIAQALAVRVAANGLSYNHSTSSDNVDYAGKLKLNSQWLLLDWMPFSGRFRLSGGLVFNHNALSLKGKPTTGDGSYEVNGTTYQLTSLDADVKFRKSAPYLGFGWGSSEATGIHFLGDIGVIAQGKPKATLGATGSGTTAPGFASDLQQAQSKLQGDLDSFRWYPILQLGLGYRF